MSLLPVLAALLACGAGGPKPDDPALIATSPADGDPADGAGALPGDGPPAPTRRPFPAAGERVTRATWGGMEELIPFQTWRPAPGRLVALIWAAGPQPWGATIAHMRHFEGSPERTEYKLSFDGASPTAVYWVSDGRGYNFMRGWTGGGGGAYDVAMFLPSTANAWGLHRRAHVVEVEVNGGAGAPANIHFVVTRARVLDRTAEVPLDPEQVLTDLRARFDAEVQAAGARIDALIRQRSDGSFQGAVTEVHAAGVFPTWMRDEHRLVATFYARRGQHWAGVATQVRGQCPPCPCTPDGRCAPCVRCDPDRFETQAVGAASVIVEVAARYVVDADGTLVSETIYEPR
jgi:hypothetical protein